MLKNTQNTLYRLSFRITHDIMYEFKHRKITVNDLSYYIPNVTGFDYDSIKCTMYYNSEEELMKALYEIIEYSDNYKIEYEKLRYKKFKLTYPEIFL